MVEASWNVMAHTPDFVFRAKRTSPFKSARWGASVQSTTGTAEVCASAVVILDTLWSEVALKGTGYPLHSPVSPSLPLPCFTVCHHISGGVYKQIELLHSTPCSCRKYVENWFVTESSGCRCANELVLLDLWTPLHVYGVWGNNMTSDRISILGCSHLTKLYRCGTIPEENFCTSWRRYG